MLINKLIKLIPKKVRKHLVKKITLNSLSFDKSNLYYHLTLSRFWFPFQKIEAIFEGEDGEKLISHTYNDNKIIVTVPLELIKNLDARANIKLKKNKKELIINAENCFNKIYGTKNVNNICVSTNVKKSIIITKRLDLASKSEVITLLSKPIVEYNQFSFKIDKILSNNIDPILKIYALTQYKTRVLNLEMEDKKTFTLQDIDILSKGKWKLFIEIDNEIYPLKINENINEEFLTYNHTAILKTDNNNLELELSPHVLTINNIQFNMTDKSLNVLIHSETLDTNKKYLLNMNDNILYNDCYYSLGKTKKGYETRIDIKDIYHSLSNKRFFILKEGSQPIKYKLRLDNELINFETFNKYINNQLYTFEMYKRIDKALGIKTKLPVIKKGITNIEGLTVSGYINNIKNNFVNCKVFLSLEERKTKKMLKIPIIDENFKVTLNKLELMKLKTEDKTLFDFYILIINSDGDTIRKEKIKYNYADYKKDNYYEHIISTDKEFNQHHFLYTTTPADNLKIESFVIPNYIKVPKETSLKDKNTWLIGERSDTAQDNGIALFQWLKKNTNIDIYYVIEKSASDYEKIKNETNVITFGSSKHYEIAFKAKVLLSTHDLENILPYKPAMGFFGYEKTYKVFLQHGVLGRKNVEYHKKYYDIPFDLFIVSSEEEKQKIVIEEMGYSEEEVAITGLARFDNLIQEAIPQDILLMPTWREWINTDEQFLKSEYYNRYINLLKNKKLLRILEDYNCTLNFYPHYRAQEYFQRELKNHSDKINFIKLGSNTVQKLLINHALLITDFSSVSFDFILMDKPVIYYHFDVKRFFRKGILRPISETFIGDIAFNEDELINYIENSFKNNMIKNYSDITGVVKYKDNKNSERIFNEINYRINNNKLLSANGKDYVMEKEILDLASKHRKNKEYKEAIYYYDKYLKEMGHFPNDKIHTYYASSLNKVGKLKEAKNLLEEGRKTFPDSARVLRQLFNLNYSLRDRKEALLIARELVEIEPSNSNNYFLLGKACASEKENEEARVSYMKGLEIKHNMTIDTLIDTIESGLTNDTSEITTEFSFFAGTSNYGAFIHYHKDKKYFTKISKITSRSKREEMFYKELCKEHSFLKDYVPVYINSRTLDNVLYLTIEMIEGVPVHRAELEHILKTSRDISSIPFNKINLEYDNPHFSYRVNEPNRLIESFTQIHEKTRNEKLFASLYKTFKQNAYPVSVIEIVKELESLIMDNKLYDFLSPEKHYSLVHGDFNRRNSMLIKENELIKVFDWEFFKIGLSTIDIARYLSISLVPYKNVEKTYLENDSLGGKLSHTEKIFFLYALILLYIITLREKRVESELETCIKPALEKMHVLVEEFNEKHKKI